MGAGKVDWFAYKDGKISKEWVLAHRLKYSTDQA